MILDSVEPCCLGLCQGCQVGDAWCLLSLMCIPGVDVCRLEMGVINVVAHHYEHFGMPPALSGSEPDRAGLTQPFATESEYYPIPGLGGLPATECGVSNVCVIMTLHSHIKGVASKDSGHFALVSTDASIG